MQQHVQDRFVTMQQRRGVLEVFGNDLGGTADVVCDSPFDVSLLLVFNNQTIMRRHGRPMWEVRKQKAHRRILHRGRQ